jgi:hypothetical protein
MTHNKRIEIDALQPPFLACVDALLRTRGTKARLIRDVSP